MSSSPPLLSKWNNSEKQQTSAPSAEAPNSRNAVHSNPLRRGEATSAQTFHKRASGLRLGERIPVLPAPMKDRSLSASVFSECSFLLKELHKAPRGSQFLQ